MNAFEVTANSIFLHGFVIASFGFTCGAHTQHPSDRGRCSVLGPRHALSDTLMATDTSQWETTFSSVSKMTAPDWLLRAGLCHPVAVALSAEAARLLEETQRGRDETRRIDEDKPQSTQTKEAVPRNDTIGIRRGQRRKRYRSPFFFGRRVQVMAFTDKRQSSV